MTLRPKRSQSRALAGAVSRDSAKRQIVNYLKQLDPDTAVSVCYHVGRMLDEALLLSVVEAQMKVISSAGSENLARQAVRDMADVVARAEKLSIDQLDRPVRLEYSAVLNAFLKEQSSGRLPRELVDAEIRDMRAKSHVAA